MNCPFIGQFFCFMIPIGDDTMHFKTKDLWTIPNIIGYIRVLMIPFIIHFYLEENYLLSSLLLLISTFSDLIDGTIARKFNMVTDLGKIIDPIADKLTHFALVICLCFRYPFMRILCILMICKEGYMAFKGLQYLKKGKMMNGAYNCGKVCTASLFIGLFFLFLFPTISIQLANGIIIFLMIVMVYTWCFYIHLYHKEDIND